MVSHRGRSAWLLVVVALASSLGAASAGAKAPASDVRAGVDDERSTAAVGRRVPLTVRMRLRGGKVVTVWRLCVIRKDIAGKNREVEAAADELDSLDAVLTRRKRAFKGFLRVHPEKALAHGAYARYRALRSAYSASVSRFNAQVARYNAAVDRHNDVLHACEV